jgi:lipoprotein-anchoring transpeptidase ErfK/SrfK
MGSDSRGETVSPPAAFINCSNPMEVTRKRRALLLLCVAAMLGLVAVVIAESQAASVQAYSGYQSSLGQIDQALKQAQTEGYTDADLQPITEKLAAISGHPEPFWVGDRATFYRDQVGALRDLRAALGDQEQLVATQARTGGQQSLAAAGAQLDKDRQLGVDDPSMKDLEGRYDTLSKTLPAAAKVADLRHVQQQADQLTSDAQKAGAAQQAENTAIQQAADAVFAQQNGSVEALRQAGRASLASGRNDATVAAYEAKPKRFAQLDELMTAYNRLEKYAPQLDSADAHQVSFATAAIQRYAGQVHNLLYGNLGPKHIIVSWTAQEAWAYEGSKQVMDTLVTTGIRGEGPFGTDFGPMKVLFTSHPWKMHSPWPQGSQYWYPDTTVQWTVFFTDSGESFHDAYWESDAALGPGSQYNLSTRSHGCIHLPYGLAQWLFGWADVGTPVDVVPGDGQPLPAQLAEMTTDDQGNPLNPA